MEDWFHERLQDHFRDRLCDAIGYGGGVSSARLSMESEVDALVAAIKAAPVSGAPWRGRKTGKRS